METRGRPRTSNRILVENCCSVLTSAALSKSRLECPQHLLKSITVTATWPDRNNQFSSVIQISRTILPNGGHRIWFRCPDCNRRCGRLYLGNETDRQYRCRLCLHAGYSVQYRRSRKALLYRYLQKVMRKPYRAANDSAARRTTRVRT